MHCVRERRDHDFFWFAHIKDENRLAVIQAQLEILRIYFSENGHVGFHDCVGRRTVSTFINSETMDSRIDIDFMSQALAEARNGAIAGEVPVGAVVVVDDKVIAAAHNQPIALCDPTAHAEVLALRAAGLALGSYRLTDARLYVTVEPCVMCIGAMVNARIAKLIFGARDEKAGAVGSVYDIGRDGRLNHRLEIYSGLMEADCAEVMREFFRTRRNGVIP
jgi:tRNA(adenine34) deaminase